MWLLNGVLKVELILSDQEISFASWANNVSMSIFDSKRDCTEISRGKSSTPLWLLSLGKNDSLTIYWILN